MPGHGVPAYGLYGERREGGFPDALHIETISARSALHHWRIQPHRHQALHQFFLITQGGGSAGIDGVTHRLRPGVAMLIPPLVIHEFSFDDDTQGFVASVGGAWPLVDPQAGGALGTALVLAGGAECEALAAMMRHALLEFANPQPGRDSALAAHAGLIALWFTRAAAREQANATHQGDAATMLLRRFAARVEAEFRAHRPVSTHARALGVSVPHLSRVCRAVLGHSAQRLLHDRLMLEARRNLAYTSMSIGQIATALGFADAAYFSRFFHARAGCSPSAYRARM